MVNHYDTITLILKNLYADIINTVTMFIKAIFKNSKKVKIIRNYVSNCNLYLSFLI